MLVLLLLPSPLPLVLFDTHSIVGIRFHVALDSTISVASSVASSAAVARLVQSTLFNSCLSRFSLEGRIGDITATRLWSSNASSTTGDILLI